MGQYTMVAQRKAKTMEGRIRPRSKEPPMTSWTVQAQNSIWYKPSDCQHILMRFDVFSRLTEDNLRQKWRAWRWRSHDILETKVVQVTDEGISSTRVSKRVAPEHPLEGNA